jgi:hypothetical protein
MSATRFLPLLASQNEVNRGFSLPPHKTGSSTLDQQTDLSSGYGCGTCSIFICARRYIDGTIVVSQVH